MNKLITSLCLIALLFGSPSHAMEYARQVELGRKLHDAAERGNRFAVKILIAQGAPIDAKCISDRTALFYAARNGHEAVCRFLIEKNATLDTRDTCGWTPLMHAVENGHKAVCRLLLEKNAEINSHYFHHGYRAVCRGLKFRDNIMDAKDTSGLNPLILAARRGHGDICKILIDAQLRRSKAAAITFLGVVRKRPKNLPCVVQKDIAIMIARWVLEKAVQKEKCNLITQINQLNNNKKTDKLLEYVNRKLSSRKKINK